MENFSFCAVTVQITALFEIKTQINVKPFFIKKNFVKVNVGSEKNISQTKRKRVELMLCKI